MKALPYGISDFPRIMRKNYYYVDKSRYICSSYVRDGSVSHCFWPCWKRIIVLIMRIVLKRYSENCI